MTLHVFIWKYGLTTSTDSSSSWGLKVAVQLLGIPKPFRHTVLDIFLIESTPIVHAQLQVVYSSWDNIVILCWFTNYIHTSYGGFLTCGFSSMFHPCFIGFSPRCTHRFSPSTVVAPKPHRCSMARRKAWGPRGDMWTTRSRWDKQRQRNMKIN